MANVVQCACGAKLQVQPIHFGKVVKCPKCSAKVAVPVAQTSAAAGTVAPPSLAVSPPPIAPPTAPAAAPPKMPSLTVGKVALYIAGGLNFLMMASLFLVIAAAPNDLSQDGRKAVLMLEILAGLAAVVAVVFIACAIMLADAPRRYILIGMLLFLLEAGFFIVGGLISGDLLKQPLGLAVHAVIFILLAIGLDNATKCQKYLNRYGKPAAG